MESDVIIVGAGVLGVSLAYHLAQRKQHVVVLEREGSYAQHASGKNAGMIRQLYRHPQLTDWAERSILSWPDAVRATAFRQNGSLVIGREIPPHHHWLFSQRQVGIILPEATAEVPAVYSNTDGLLDPYDFVAGLYQLTDKTFVEYRFREPVTMVECHTGQWRAVTANGYSFRAPWLVNASGAWLNEIVVPQHSSEAIAAKPYVRHLFLVDGWREHYMPYKDVGFYWDEANEWYMRKWDKFLRLVSICDKLAVNRPEDYVPNSAIEEALAQKLLCVLPEQALNLRLANSWFCFRTYTEDLLPVWGESSSAPGLFWLAAFGGFGMSTAYAATLDAADYMIGKDVRVTSDFAPRRVQHR